MALIIENLDEREGQKSTTSIMPFNDFLFREGASPRFQPAIGLHAAGVESITARSGGMGVISISGCAVCASFAHGRSAPEPMSTAVWQFPCIGRPSIEPFAGAEEFDCLVKVDSGVVYVIEVKSLHNRSTCDRSAIIHTMTAARAHPRSLFFPDEGSDNRWAEQTRVDELKLAVGKLFRSGQHDRPQVLAELVDLSRRGSSLAGIKLSLDLILNSGLHERVLAAREFLNHLGSFNVKQLASTSDRMEGSYGYAVVRTLGTLGERDEVLRFAGAANESLREAVAEALDDIGDATSLHALRMMHEQDESEFIRNLAEELLADH
jgi:HEAT repeat protein